MFVVIRCNSFVSSSILIMCGCWWQNLPFLEEAEREKKNKKTLHAPVKIWGPVAYVCAWVYVIECLSAWLSFHREAYGEYT